MPEKNKNCEPGVHDNGSYYSKKHREANIDGSYNYVVENKGTTVVMLDDTIDLQPAGQAFSVRSFIPNVPKKYKGNVKLTWTSAALATDRILVICTNDKG